MRLGQHTRRNFREKSLEKATIERVHEQVWRDKIGQYFITHSKLYFQLQESPIYMLKDDLSYKFIKSSLIGLDKRQVMSGKDPLY